jgi:hypothetical protein
VSRHLADPAVLACVLCVLISPAAAAQSKPLGWHPADRGTMRIDGSGSLASNTTWIRGGSVVPVTITERTQSGLLNVTVQYFVANHLALGLTGSVSFSSWHTEDGTNSGNQSSYAGGPSLAWVFGTGRAILPYVQVAGELGGYSDRNFTGSGSGRESRRTTSYTVSAGANLMFASYVGADVAVEYFDFKTSETVSEEQSGVRLRLGLAVFVRP